ncbi:MAG: NAD(P)/FAD-dependent oxidoreductase [Pseudomonadota bacterium]
MMKEKHYDAIVLGAGGAGLMCAAVAGQFGARILLVDHADKPGKKILISGGGRCNFTNVEARAETYLSDNPHFARSALSRYRPDDFIALVDRYEIAWHEKTLGQLFCDGSARQIVDMLMTEIPRDRVDVSLGTTVREIARRDDRYRVQFDGETAVAPALVVATGGPSIPKMGATGFAYDIARQFGLRLVTPRPALVPLTVPHERRLFDTLAGVAAHVTARCGAAVFEEACLVTHRGLSGPAILQVSSYWQPGEAISLNFLSGHAAGQLRSAKASQPKARLATWLATLMPERLAKALSQNLEMTAPLGTFRDRDLDVAEARLRDWQIRPDGTEGFAKAEVTAGGVNTRDLSSRTMMAASVPGLYVIGEAVDVTGWLGGYNFQWAWASGFAAARAIEEQLGKA